MKYLMIALVYLGFYGLLGFAIWHTEEPLILWALLLSPGIETLLGLKFGESKEKKE